MRNLPVLQLRVSASSHPGNVRYINQDWWGQFVPSHPSLRAAKGALFVLADGMGGRAGGEVASQLAVQHLLRAYYTDPSTQVEKSLARAMQRTNASVYHYAQQHPAYRGMATTLVAAVVRGSELVVAHVGDSRAYLVHGQRVLALTRDHSWVGEMMARGVLTPAEAAHHPYRHVILRSIGAHPSVSVDVKRWRLRPGDTLVLCTDGLSDYLTPPEIGWAAAKLPPHQAAQALINRALQRGGADNVSVIVVRAEPPLRQRSCQARAGMPRPVIPASGSAGCQTASLAEPIVTFLFGLGLAAVGLALTMAVLASW